jgi:hypothetical protein
MAGLLADVLIAACFGLLQSAAVGQLMGADPLLSHADALRRLQALLAQAQGANDGLAFVGG